MTHIARESQRKLLGVRATSIESQDYIQGTWGKDAEE